MLHNLSRTLLMAVALALAVLSCTKNVELPDQVVAEDDNYTTSELKSLQAPYDYHGCCTMSNGEYLPGIECLPTATDGNCLARMDCTPVRKQSLSEFTDEEMKQWLEGFDVFHSSADFVRKHYNFYLELFQQGIGVHPDIVIEDIESANPNYFSPQPCDLASGGVGVMCSVSAVPYECCPKRMDCTPVGCTDEFTEEELALWNEGKFAFDLTVDFVQKHYEFFKCLGQKGLSYHPDWLIENLNK